MKIANFTPPDAGGSVAVLPLLTSTRPLGVLELEFSYRRRFGRDDRVYMLALAGQGARALERSLLYQAERAARRNAEEAGERLAFLAQASEVLGSSLDYKTTLATVTRLAVPRLADWCAVDVIDDGRLRRLAIAHTDPARVDEVWEMSRRYAELPADPVPRAIATGQPQLVPVIPDQLLRAFARDPEHLERLRLFGLRSLLIVPLAVLRTALPLASASSVTPPLAWAGVDVIAIRSFDPVSVTVTVCTARPGMPWKSPSVTS